jgi:hypothetical protein
MMIKTARDQEVYNSYYQAGVKLAMEQLGLLKMAEEGDAAELPPEQEDLPVQQMDFEPMDMVQQMDFEPMDMVQQMDFEPMDMVQQMDFEPMEMVQQMDFPEYVVPRSSEASPGSSEFDSALQALRQQGGLDSAPMPTQQMDFEPMEMVQQMDFPEYVVPRSSEFDSALQALRQQGGLDSASAAPAPQAPAPAPAPQAPAPAPAPQAPAPAPAPQAQAPQQVTFGRGGARNLTQAFRQLGIQGADRRQAMQRLRSQGFDPNKVRAGQTLTREQLMGGGNIGNRVFARLPGQVAARGRNVRNPTPSAATASNQTNRMISQAQRAPMQQLTSPSMRRGQTRLNYPQPGVMQSSRPNLATPARRQVSTPRMPAEFKAMAPQSAQGRPNRS